MRQLPLDAPTANQETAAEKSLEHGMTYLFKDEAILMPNIFVYHRIFEFLASRIYHCFMN